ncbi:type II toxin-antitoxin system RelE/ParE family toxin [Candidatus Saccharibacteria bacterium]|nr:type II toxin-antitoxin system RelE/ParE family toxin [Candidatus Saccharibacteria bacterium]
MTYQINFSSDAVKALQRCYEYYLFQINEVGNPIIAQHFLEDIDSAIARILSFPKSGTPITVPPSDDYNFRKVHLSHYDYKIIYHLFKNQIIIDIICHDKEDYTKFFE